MTSATTAISVPTGAYIILPDLFMYYNYTSFYVIEDGSMIAYAIEYFYGQSYIIRVRFTTRIIPVLHMKGAIKYEIY